MKLIRYILAALAITTIAVQAQSGFDTFGGLRAVQLASTGVKSGAAVGIVTNNPVDLRAFNGVATVFLNVTTNAGGGTLTCTLYTSPDLTNWTALANYALASTTSIIYTNNTYGSNLTATNSVLLPGTATTPTATTAGFATPYVLPAPFTNSGAITVSSAGAYSVGFVVKDANRYIQTVWTPGGSVTNYGASATLIAKLGI